MPPRTLRPSRPGSPGPLTRIQHAVLGSCWAWARKGSLPRPRAVVALGDLGVGTAAPQELSLLRDASQGGRAQTTGSPGTHDRCSAKAGRNPWGEP